MTNPRCPWCPEVILPTEEGVTVEGQLWHRTCRDEFEQLPRRRHVNVDLADLLDTRQFAELIGLAPRTLTSELNRGRVPKPVRHFSNVPVWTRRQAEAFVKLRQSGMKANRAAEVVDRTYPNGVPKRGEEGQ